MKPPLCSWCKKPIETDNHYAVTRKYKFFFLSKKQVWEFHSLAEIKSWAGHKPKDGE